MHKSPIVVISVQNLHLEHCQCSSLVTLLAELLRDMEELEKVATT